MNIIKLSKPYIFEGEEYTEIDLRGIEDLKTKDFIEIDKIWAKQGNNPALCGLTLDYAILVAHRITSLPLEFFNDFEVKKSMKIKEIVSNFLFSEE